MKQGLERLINFDSKSNYSNIVTPSKNNHQVISPLAIRGDH